MLHHDGPQIGRRSSERMDLRRGLSLEHCQVHGATARAPPRAKNAKNSKDFWRLCWRGGEGPAADRPDEDGYVRKRRRKSERLVETACKFCENDKKRKPKVSTAPRRDAHFQKIAFLILAGFLRPEASKKGAKTSSKKHLFLGFLVSWPSLAFLRLPWPPLGLSWASLGAPLASL